MTQLTTCDIVEPLVLEHVPFEGKWITLFDARYNYTAKQFEGYAQFTGGVRRVGVSLTPRRAVEALSKWVHGWITGDQIARLFKLAAGIARDQRIVELGSWKGKSTLALGWGSKSGNSAQVWAVDPHTGTSRYWLWYNKGVPGSTYAQHRANIVAGGVDDIVYTLVETGLAAAGMIRQPVGLLFVDADHDYAAQDVCAWLPKVAPGGWVALHDTQYPSVCAAIEIINETGEFGGRTDVDNMAVFQRKTT